MNKIKLLVLFISLFFVLLTCITGGAYFIVKFAKGSEAITSYASIGEIIDLASGFDYNLGLIASGVPRIKKLRKRTRRIY